MAPKAKRTQGSTTRARPNEPTGRADERNDEDGDDLAGLDEEEFEEVPNQTGNQAVQASSSAANLAKATADGIAAAAARRAPDEQQSPKDALDRKLQALLAVDVDEMNDEQIAAHERQLAFVEKLVVAADNDNKRKRVESEASRAPSTHTSDGPSKRGHHDPLYNLLRKDPPTLQSANNQEFQQWILEVERMFLLHGADEDSHRRSVWASGGIKRGVTAVIQAVNTRLEAYSASATLPAIREPLYWAELIQIIQDAIKNPAVRRGEQAVLYWNATMRPSQTVATFFNYMKNMEKSFDVPMVDGYHRINFYYTKLPERIRDRLIEGNVLKDITSTDELMDHALRHEQTSTRTPIAARQVDTPRGVRGGNRGARGEYNPAPRGGYRGRGRGGLGVGAIGSDANTTPIPHREHEDRRPSGN
ncbi:hypothetical protein LTS12_026488 [Elasticomyces elasticus]|nr:hypothetical protein LTS12_026488 [Elasticomyces elasticus]